jgi:small ligand-binding sensory domain FIST
MCPEGMILKHAVRDEERMFEDLDTMVEQIIERCAGRKPYAVFHADCTARGRFSLDRILKEEYIQRMQSPLIEDSDVPWLGLYGFGEFAQLGERNRFHMMTTALFVILKKEG